MGYYYTTSPENAVPGKSCATPKTHTPDPPVKERGHRFYQPETGRWLSRDPLSEWSVFRNVIKRPSSLSFQIMSWLSRLPQYLSVYNRPIDHYDPDGLYGNPVSGPNGPVGPSDPYPNYPHPIPPPSDGGGGGVFTPTPNCGGIIRPCCSKGTCQIEVKQRVEDCLAVGAGTCAFGCGVACLLTSGGYFACYALCEARCSVMFLASCNAGGAVCIAMCSQCPNP